MNTVCCKCKILVVNSTSCAKCKNVFHLSYLRTFKNYSLIADDVNSINSCPRCDKPSKSDLENTTITLLREQNDFLRAELDELKKSFKDSVKHILDKVEERVSMLFENLRDDLKSSITTSVRQEFDGFKPVVDTFFKTNLRSISSDETPACTPSETDKPYLPKTQLFNRRKIPVLLRDDNIHLLVWRMGFVSELHKGDDNLFRTVTVNTTTSLTTRAMIPLSTIHHPFLPEKGAGSRVSDDYSFISHYTVYRECGTYRHDLYVLSIYFILKSNYFFCVFVPCAAQFE
ncbi:hypothetical protein Zmor_006415 [Zophobas morio]|uniref:DUF5641 domain-containing protein n=1 Tax=Zophobas morio TaxID=2755281 RepID=A0AA38MND1_9CUCU|nr:hypothetical protein Zmor_006415 [Zophobas morio]